MKKENIQEENASFSFWEILDEFFGNITIADANGTQLYVNQGVCDVYDMTREELIGTNLKDLVDRGYINDSSILEVTKNKQPTMRYIKTSKGDGLYSITNPVFDEQGEMKYIVCLSHSEELYEQVLSHISKERRQLEDAMMFFSQQDSEISYFTGSPAVKNLYSMARQIASFDSAVIITGETGSGKDVLARYIHQNSSRSTKLFIPVNCSAIPAELFEMEFFGYVKGSFTGALDQGKAGLFETAANGTLFLDEIGELPLSMQAKLLRVLEDGEFLRIGSNTPQKTDVRIIAATNRNLREMVRNGTFREDLYYRLSVVSLAVPALRERSCDIKPLAQHFLALYNRKYNRDMHFAEDTIHFLENYSWPGNIRELKNIIESMAVSAPSSLISTKNSFFNFEAMLSNQLTTQTTAVSFDDPKQMLPDNQLISSGIRTLPTLEDNEKALMVETLKKYNGNIQRAAMRLGISRQTLYRKIKKSGIDVKQMREL